MNQFPRALTCTAKAKSTGQRCRNAAVTNKWKDHSYNVCRVHGGAVNPANFGKGNLKHGNRSKKVIEQRRQERITFKYIADALQIGLQGASAKGYRYLDLQNDADVAFLIDHLEQHVKPTLYSGPHCPDKKESDLRWNKIKLQRISRCTFIFNRRYFFAKSINDFGTTTDT